MTTPLTDVQLRIIVPYAVHLNGVGKRSSRETADNRKNEHYQPLQCVGLVEWV